jgi:hypothetical protein
MRGSDERSGALFSYVDLAEMQRTVERCRSEDLVICRRLP